MPFFSPFIWRTTQQSLRKPSSNNFLRGKSTTYARRSFSPFDEKLKIDVRGPPKKSKISHQNLGENFRPNKKRLLLRHVKNITWERIFFPPNLAHIAAKSTKDIFKPLSGIELYYLSEKGFSPFDAGLKNDVGGPPPKSKISHRYLG
jgi:hypothetical protein